VAQRQSLCLLVGVSLEAWLALEAAGNEDRVKA
jgi:hypothetical protein